MERNFPPLPVRILVVLIILGAIGYFAIRSFNTPEDGQLKASGTIEAVTVNNSPEMAGKVKEALVVEGQSVKTGDPLFKDDGAPTELTMGVQQQLEQLEIDIERTRRYGEKLVELGLLRDMQFEATLPNGQKVQVNGFLTVDGDKVNALSDAQMLELARTGLLGLIHAHQISLSNMTRLAEWQAERDAGQPTPAPVAPNLA